MGETRKTRRKRRYRAALGGFVPYANSGCPNGLVEKKGKESRLRLRPGLALLCGELKISQHRNSQVRILCKSTQSGVPRSDSEIRWFLGWAKEWAWPAIFHSASRDYKPEITPCEGERDKGLSPWAALGEALRLGGPLAASLAGQQNRLFCASQLGTARKL